MRKPSSPTRTKANSDAFFAALPARQIGPVGLAERMQSSAEHHAERRAPPPSPPMSLAPPSDGGPDAGNMAAAAAAKLALNKAIFGDAPDWLVSSNGSSPPDVKDKMLLQTNGNHAQHAPPPLISALPTDGEGGLLDAANRILAMQRGLASPSSAAAAAASAELLRHLQQQAASAAAAARAAEEEDVRRLDAIPRHEEVEDGPVQQQGEYPLLLKLALVYFYFLQGEET